MKQILWQRADDYEVAWAQRHFGHTKNQNICVSYENMGPSDILTCYYQCCVSICILSYGKMHVSTHTVHS